MYNTSLLGKVTHHTNESLLQIEISKSKQVERECLKMELDSDIRLF
jgi:hypothetical protein